MSSARKPELQVLSLIGLCLTCIQQTERTLQVAIDTVLDNPAIKLAEQSEPERKQTLGDLLRKLRKRIKLETGVKERLYRFRDMRNAFVHDPSLIPGWDLSTPEGRKIAQEFTLELTLTALAVSALFMTVFNVWAKDNFNEAFFEVEAEREQHILSIFESQFGAKARKILAEKVR